METFAMGAVVLIVIFTLIWILGYCPKENEVFSDRILRGIGGLIVLVLLLALIFGLGYGVSLELEKLGYADFFRS